MYNERQKIRFLDDVGLAETTRGWAITVFNSTEKLESEYDMDIARMTADDTGRALCYSSIMSASTFANRASFIIKYKKWCNDNGIDSILISSKDIKMDLTDSMRTSMIYSPSQLRDITLEAFPDKDGLRSMAPAYRAMLWFAFAGIYDIDAATIKDSDVNFDARVVNVNGRWYELHEYSIKDIRSAIKVDAFDRRMSDGSIHTFRRADGDTILRGRKLKRDISPERYVEKTLRSVVNVAMTSIGKPGMSYIKVRKSGIYYNMLMREVRGFHVNFYTVAHDDFDHSTNHDSPTPEAKQKMISRTVLNYLRDYAAWKKAFEKELRNEFNVNKLP